ncbi:MAG: hypothetical protein ACRC3Y_16220 [Romboutsia sp.]|uniref:hypothetical protein n=1 Tax=Romboutsia sp. TaxID=1965302 RepID=UPI003F381CC1
MNFNKKVLNWSIIISLLSAYVLPGKSHDGFGFEYGYPVRFFTRFNMPIKAGDTILNSTNIDLGSLIMNVFIIYFVIYFLDRIISKIKTS